MLRSIVAVCLVVTLTPFSVLAQSGKEKTSLPQLGKSDVKEVIKAMSVGEKAKLLVGMGMDINAPGFPAMDPEDKKTPERVPGAAGRTHHAKGKKAIVVLNIGGVTEVASWRDRVDAVLLAWQPGQEGGHAIADALSGKVNPSGKLATTFPVTYDDVPSAKNFPGKELAGQKSLINNPFGGKPSEVTYEEGIYVGYRYYNTFGVKPAYEFGYGLSYTDFSYGDLKLSSKRLDRTVMASVTVTNTGKVPGKEVAQLYVSAPGKKLNKPESELKAFAKREE
jgi:beta-glucosidase